MSAAELHGVRRLVVLDLIRSAALLSMALFHLCYDLDAFYGERVLVWLGVWADVWARSTAVIFLVLCGMGVALSALRANARGLAPKAWRKRMVRRGVGVIACGMLVSLATWLINPETFVRFGILHCIGTGLLLLIPIARRPRSAMLGAAGVVAAWFALRGTLLTTNLLLPLGLHTAAFTSVDYFPLLPWLWWMLLGCAAAQPLLHLALRIERIGLLHTAAARCLAFPGRWSLAFYLLHQPVILGALALLRGLPQ